MIKKLLVIECALVLAAWNVQLLSQTTSRYGAANTVPSVCMAMRPSRFR
jgi:hypothetical protein